MFIMLRTVTYDGNIGNSRQATLTIEHALTQVSAGDTVHVMPGVYEEVFLVIPGVTHAV